MISKAELKSKVEEQEKQLQLIYKYNPSLRFIETNVPVLQSLGLDEDEIKKVITRGFATLTQTITNPTTGEEMAIFVEEVSIQKDISSGEYCVFIGKVPYREFFDRTLMTKTTLEELAKKTPEIRTVYEENQQLKALLAQLSIKQ